MPWKNYMINNTLEIPIIHSFFEEHVYKGYYFPGEKHDFWECVFVLKGEIYATGDGQVYCLTEDDIIFHKPLEFHKLSATNTEADILIFTFTSEKNFMDYFKNKVFHLLAEQKNIILELLAFARTQNQNFNFNDYPKEFRYLEKNKDDAVYMQTVTAYIKLLLFSLCGKSVEVSAENNQDALILKTAVNYMNANITKNISTKEVAMHVNVSLATLKRIFDKYAGISIHQYFLKLKINYASELLKNGASVSETALKLNFCSQAYFSKAFLRETGKHPSSLKKGDV